MKIFLLEIFTALSLAASSAMRLRSLHSWLIASMQADDLIPNNWNGPADKGRCVVVLDKTEYHQKCETLLNDTKTYKRLGKRNPTSGYKKQLVSLLTKIEADHQINRDEYHKLYPTTETQLTLL